MTKHEWECAAPDGGYYSWQCKNCTEWRRYPSRLNPDDECSQNLIKKNTEVIISE